MADHAQQLQSSLDFLSWRAMKKLSLMLLVVCFVQCAAAAQIEAKPDAEFCSSMTIRLAGTIRRGDAARLEQAVQVITQQAKRVYGECFFAPSVILQSHGGDVAEALTMGKLIRDAGLATSVPVNGECFSSCVFLFAAGVERKVWRNGQVGIHRPYLRDVDEHASVGSIRSQRASQIERIRSYIEGMDLSLQLLDAMLAVPPDEVRILTEDEMRDYRITGTDASFEEFQVNWNAKMFDLSSSEYRRRHAIALTACENTDETNVCASASILGISLAESQGRWSRYMSCKQRVKNELTQRECFRSMVTHGGAQTTR